MGLGLCVLCGGGWLLLDSNSVNTEAWAPDRVEESKAGMPRESLLILDFCRSVSLSGGPYQSAKVGDLSPTDLAHITPHRSLESILVHQAKRRPQRMGTKPEPGRLPGGEQSSTPKASPGPRENLDRCGLCFGENSSLLMGDLIAGSWLPQLTSSSGLISQDLPLKPVLS